MTILVPTRRGFLAGALGALAAPAIVRISSIMPVTPIYGPAEVRMVQWVGPSEEIEIALQNLFYSLPRKAKFLPAADLPPQIESEHMTYAGVNIRRVRAYDLYSDQFVNQIDIRFKPQEN